MLGAGRLLRQIELLAPVRLQKDAVDLLELDGSGAVAHVLGTVLTSYAAPELTSYGFGEVARLTSQFATETVAI